MSSRNPTSTTTSSNGVRRLGLTGALALMGPSFIAGAWQFGPGNLTTAVAAGSSHGYTLLWVIAISTVLMLVYTDMSVRLAVVSPSSLVQSIKTELHPLVGVAAGVGVFLITLCFSVGNAVGSGLGFALLFGGSPTLWTLACTVIVGVVVWARNFYNVLERGILAIVGLMAVGFVASTFMSKPDWVAAADGLIPTLPAETGLLVVALVGTNFSINAAFFTGYASRQRGLRRDEYRLTTLADTIPGIVAPGIMTMMVIIAAAAALSQVGGQAATLGDLAKVLEPVAGDLGVALFAMGFSGAALSSMVANATAGGMLLSDALGKGNSLSDPLVRIIMCTILAVGLTVTIVADGSPVQLITTAQALTVGIAPLLGVLLMVMANRRGLMGEFRNAWWQNVLGVAGLAAIFATSYRLLTVIT